MAFSTYYTSAVSIDGNNYLRFRFDGERIGNTVTIKNIYLNPRWAVDSLASGWNFQIKVNGTLQKQETKANFTAGNYSTEYASPTLLWSGPFSYSVTYSSNATITIGIPSMYYNGSNRGDKFCTYTFGPVENPNSGPGTPTISCSTNPLNGNYYGESSIAIALSTVSDPNGDPVSYRIYGEYKVPGGSFVNWDGGSNLVSTDRTRTVDISSFARGTQFRFWGYAKDDKDAWSGKSNVIENIYKNKIPNTPSISCSNTNLGGRYVSETSISVSLSSVSDPDGHSVSYRIYGQYNDGSGWKTLGNSSNLIASSQSTTVNISSYGRGTQFQFWGYAVDSLGAWSSQSSVISNIYKNRVPGTPTVSCSNVVALGDRYVSESSVTVSLSSVSDPDGSSVSYKIYGQYHNGSSWVSLGGSDNLIANSQSTTVNISGYGRGTRFQFWGYAVDAMGAWSAQSNVISNVYRNRQPNTPTLSCSNTNINGKYIGESSISVQLSNPGDPDGGSISYKIYGQYNNGSGWKTLGDSSNLVASSQSTTVNISSYSRGTQFKFWGFIVDNFGIWSAQSSSIENIYRNRQPNAPTVSCSNTLVNGRYIGENSLSISITTPGDPDGGTVTYAIYGQYYNGSSWVGLGNSGSNLVSNSSSATINIASYSRGTQFKFWSHSSDNFGVASAKSNELSNVYRNRVGSVSGIGPASKTITGNTIPLTWNATIDPDGQSVTYNIFVSKNNGAYSKITTQAQNSYNYNISNDAKGTIYKFKISANDGMANTAEVESPTYRKNFAPERILPKATCKVFQKNPRIVISKVKLDDVYICVSYNNKKYNSKNNASMFTTKNIDSNGETVYVFTCSELIEGLNTITINNSDGTFDSTSLTFKITVENVDDSILEQIVKVEGIDTIRNKCNELRNSYELSNSAFDNLTKGNSLIEYTHIPPIRTSIDDVRDKINAYDSNTITEKWDSISTGSIIKKSDFQQLINSLKNT